MGPRDEQPDLETRRDGLRARLADVTQRADELRAAVEQRDAVERALADVEGRLSRRARGRLSVLDDLRIASPCNASWEAMKGDDRVRFCGDCRKSVYNLSAMTRAEAERLLAERAGNGSVCVRLYQRDDGTVLTTDCPVGARRRRRRRIARGLAGAGVMAATSAFAVATTFTQGKPALPQQAELSPPRAAEPTATAIPEPTARPKSPMMGGITPHLWMGEPAPLVPEPPSKPTRARKASRDPQH